MSNDIIMYLSNIYTNIVLHDIYSITGCSNTKGAVPVYYRM